jgi:hypothetical protein
MKLIALLTGMTIPLFSLACGGTGEDPTGENTQDLTFPGFPDGGPFALPPLPPLPTGFPIPPLPTAFPPLPTINLPIPPLPTGFPLPSLPDGGPFFIPPFPGH